MKKLVTIIALGMFVVGAVFAQQTTVNTTAKVEMEQKDTAIIEFSKTSHNFGTINQGTQAKTTFTYTNKGTVDVILTNVRPSCGCTVPNWSREPLAPGETAEIQVNFNSSGKSGNFHKSITVTSNAGSTTLYIRGVIKVEETKPASPVRIGN